MKASIDVKDRQEAEHIRAGLNDPATRAFVVVMGVLSTLPSERSKLRVLTFVRECFEEQNNAAADPP